MNSNTGMWHLLWKDFYQVRPALAGCLIMLACLQLLYLVTQLLEHGTSMAIFQEAYVIALIAPTLTAIACSGLLVGQERQTRTWNWSSSLPIAWSTALASKFVVWLVASVVMTILLLVLYILLYRVALLTGRSPFALTAWHQSADASFAFAMLLLVPIEVFVVFNVAALLWNDTLLALVIAAIAVCFGHLLLVDTSARAIHGIAANAPYRPQEHLATAVTLLVASIALAALGLCYAFRWRWTSGQLASFSLRDYVRSRGWPLRRDPSLAYAAGYKKIAASGRNVLAARSGKPSEAAMLVVHAWRSGLAIRWAIVISVLAVLMLAPAEWQIYPLSMIFAALLLGVSVFGSEHAGGCYRFFADRGASWIRFLITHALVPLAWLLVFAVIAHWLLNSQARLTQFDSPIVLVVLLCAFGVGLFSSLCITNSVIATALATSTFIACVSCYVIADAFWESLVGQKGHVYAVLPGTAIIVLIAILYQTRRWFVFERPRSVRVLIAAWLVGLAGPIWLSLTFGYLAVPAVEWQGVPVEQAQVGAQARLPEFKTPTPGVVVTIPPPMLSSSSSIDEQIADSYRYNLNHIQQEAGGIQAWLDAWEGPVEQLADEISDSDALEPASLQSLLRYSSLIEESAFMGVVATRARDRTRALAAWRLNHSLLELGRDNVDLATRSLAARTSAWGLWNLLDENDLAFLQDENDLKQLMPGHVDSEMWRQSLRNRWTIRKLALRSDGLPSRLPPTGRNDPGSDVYPSAGLRAMTKYYPPLRWAVERVMAAQLARELKTLDGNWTLLRPYANTLFNHDSMAYQLELLRHLEQKVNAKIPAAE